MAGRSTVKHKLHEKVYYSFKGLYYASAEMQTYMMTNELHREINVHEFATIKFSGCRRIGTTYSIARFCSEKQIMPALVLPNRQIADSAFRTWSHFLKKSTFIVTIEEIRRGALKGGAHIYYKPMFPEVAARPIRDDEPVSNSIPVHAMRYDATNLDVVLVDNSMMLSERDIEGIYETFYHAFDYAMRQKRPFFWIFVG